MTRTHIDRPENGGICSACEHDLQVQIRKVKKTEKNPKGQKSNGRCYCTNAKCKYFKTAHPTTPHLNTVIEPA